MVVDRNNAFEKAFQELLSTTKSKPKKHLSKFLLKCQNAAHQVSLKTASDLVDQAEHASSERKSRRITRDVLEPLVTSMKAYDKVISTLCNADPMPTAVIWGALKVVVDCTDRFANLFALIQNQLRTLRLQIEDVQEYEALFGRSPELQRALFEFYKDVIRFWSRVDKECSRPAVLSVMQAVVPLATTKITKILEAIEADVDQIESKVRNIDLRESKEERELSEQARQAQKEAEISALHGQLREWLEPSAYQFSSDTHQKHIQNTMEGTLEWLREDPDIRAWSSAESKNPSLWATAAPGFGKTMACSKAIENFKQDHPDAAVCYHFYQGAEMHTPREVLRSFASQLLESVWSGVSSIIPDVRKAIQKHKDIVANIVALIELLINQTKSVFFFTDGLDEVITMPDTRIVYDVFNTLVCKFGGKVRFWHSSQSTAYVREWMVKSQMINFDGRNTEDVRWYLHEALSHKYQNEDVDEEDQVGDMCEVASQLGEKAHGSFMWAFLMKHDIDSAETPADLSTIIESDVPDGLDQYFLHILHRIEKAKWPLASLLLSLVCFARRPLRVSELRDAVAILRSKDESSIDRAQRPFPKDVQKILLPLIQPSDSDHYGKVYKTCHSTLKDFLEKNPNVFCVKSADSCDITISGSILGDACLRYLRQEKFSRLLLRRDGLWYIQDGSETGSTIEKNPFTSYAAKYWSSHLNAFAQNKTSAIYTKTAEFIRSSNFWTTLQLQSLYVAGQFWTYSMIGANGILKGKKRFLPQWYVHEPDNPGFKQFKTFLNDWSYFLDNEHRDNPYSGEIDRCFLSDLGLNGFSADIKQRYNSFSLSPTGHTNSRESQYERCSPDGKLLSLLNMRCCKDNDQFELRISYFRNGMPKVPYSTINLSVSTDSIDWLPYTCFKHLNCRSCVCVLNPPVAGVSSCGRIIRVGSKIWSRDMHDKLIPLQFEGESLARLALEHVECKDDLIFVTSRYKIEISRKFSHMIRTKTRQKSIIECVTQQDTQSENQGPIGGKCHLDCGGGKHCLTHPCSEKPAITAENTKRIEDDSSESNSTDGDASSSVMNEFEAEQYWSEGSTSAEEHNILVEDVPMHCAASHSEDDKTSCTSESEAFDDNDTKTKATSDSEMSVTVNIGVSGTAAFEDSALGQHQYFEDQWDEYIINIERGGDDGQENYGGFSNDERDFGHDEDRFEDWLEEDAKQDDEVGQSDYSDDDNCKPKRENKTITKDLVASLKVYRSEGGKLKPVFKFKWPDAVPPCNSPPAIHPSKSLVVWPVTGSLLLFADYSENTWFKKMLRPPRGCQFLTTRCHFSACGNYLHIAALKHRLKNSAPKQTNKKSKSPNENAKDDGDMGESPFSLIVLTYVLSRRKTSYSPPRLLHRQAISLPTMKYPMLTFVWTKDELFTTVPSLTLTVIRIKLFRHPRQDGVPQVKHLQPVCGEEQSNASPKNSELSNQVATDAQVRMLNETICLPWSAIKRPVYFIPSEVQASFPANSAETNKRVSTLLIGPERSPIVVHCTPELIQELMPCHTKTNCIYADSTVEDIANLLDEKLQDDRVERRFIGGDDCAQTLGVLLDDKDDLGGWRVSDSIEKIAEGRGMGILDDMMELFDADDDCDDVEQWFID